MAEFVEQDCTVAFQGKSFTAGGAHQIGNRLVAYLGKAGTVTTWHGGPIGTYRTVSTWKTPRSYVSGTMSQVTVLADGVYYTGRSAGVGMAFSGRRKAKQAWR